MNFETYNLFLDDVRNPEDCVSYTNEPRYRTRKWVVVRTHNEFLTTILNRWTKGEFPELVSFDHDLADEHYNEEMYKSREAYDGLAEGFREKTGYDTAKFFVEFCVDQSIELPECLVHSMNPVGRKKIIEVIHDFDKIYKITRKN